MRNEVREVRRDNDGSFRCTVSPVRPIPDEDPWFETTWQQWHQGEIFNK